MKPFDKKNNHPWPGIAKRWTNGKLVIGFAPPVDNLETSYQSPVDVIALYQSPFSGVGGNGTSRIKPFQAGPSDFAFVPQGADQYCRSARSGELLYVACPASLRQRYIEEIPSAVKLDEPTPPAIHLDRHKIISSLIRDFLLSDGEGGALRAEGLVSLLMTDIFQQLAKRQGAEKKLGLGVTKTKEITDYIDSHVDDDLSIQVLSQIAGVSSFHFVRMFKTETGISPHRFVMRHRVQKVKSLLANSKISLADIAYRVGFSSQSHMTSSFRKLVGTSPGRYRKSLGK